MTNNNPPPMPEMYTDAWGNTCENPIECFECGGKGVSYEETCVTCGGKGRVCRN